jgi:hypothetical protein
MDQYVAVKPSVDLAIGSLKLLRALEASNTRNDEGWGGFEALLIKSGRPVLMREALLFDKICIEDNRLQLDESVLSRLLDGLENRANIFSFTHGSDPYARFRGGSLPNDLKNDLTTLLEFGEKAYEKRDYLIKEVHALSSSIDKEPTKEPRVKPIKAPRTKAALLAKEAMLSREKAALLAQLDELHRILDRIDTLLIDDEYPMSDFATRLKALELEYLDQVVATPLLPYTKYQQDIPHSARHDIAQLVIHNLPLPNEATSWEQIIEYRENPDNRNALLGLRRWIRKTASEDIRPAECVEELEWLQSEFQAHMRLHKMKANMGTLEVLVKTPLEVLENLLTLKFSKVVDPLFAIKKRQISLMEAELNAPGREIAYLIKAKQSFEK